MKLVWEIEFWCENCNGNITGRVYNEHDDEPLPESEKPTALEHLKHYHQIDQHTTCWNCGRNIKPHEIADVLWRDQTWKDLCKECADHST